MMITPDAALDDGLLDVCVVGRVSRADFLRTFPKVFDGTHTRNPLVHDAAREARRRSRCPRHSTPPELWASGERVGPLPARLEAVPDALRVVRRPTVDPLDGERAFHALRAVPEDVAVEGVLPRLQVDLLRRRVEPPPLDLELEARLLAVVEHQVWIPPWPSSSSFTMPGFDGRSCRA